MAAAFARTVPVIGLPIKPSIGDGMDSLVSITNMPNGVSVSRRNPCDITGSGLTANRSLQLVSIRPSMRLCKPPSMWPCMMKGSRQDWRRILTGHRASHSPMTRSCRKRTKKRDSTSGIRVEPKGYSTDTRVGHSTTMMIILLS